MTFRQRGRLYHLGKEMKVYIPFSYFSKRDKTQAVTKAEASTLISMLEDGVRPSYAHIHSLGRSSIPMSSLPLQQRFKGRTDEFQYEPPQHPQEWQHPYGQPTRIQLDWLTKLISLMSVPHEVMLQTLAWVTIGHASLLIKRLRAYQELQRIGCLRQDGMVLFDRAIECARKELPFLEEEDAMKHEEVVELEDTSTPNFTIPASAVASNVVVKVETWSI